MAVTKGVGLPTVRSAVALGLTRFGENRVQEALHKLEALPDAEWHFIGRLQANKARAAARFFSAIHSVDSLPLLARVERLAGEEGASPVVLLQVNVTRERWKAGFDPDRLLSSAGVAELSRAMAELRHVRVDGFMAIGPLGAPADEARHAFAKLRDLRDRIRESSGRPLPELSMGMSADLEAAVAEGATLVRIGTALFGARPRA